MVRRYEPEKDTVRDRSEGRCEKCGGYLTRRRSGKSDRYTDRTIHHRKPVRCGGLDTVVNMVNLCVACHRFIHANEELVTKGGWIVLDRHPRNVPFLGWRGWLQPRLDGGLTLLDFESGRAVHLPRVRPRTTRPAPVSTPRRKRSRQRKWYPEVA